MPLVICHQKSTPKIFSSLEKIREDLKFLFSLAVNYANYFTVKKMYFVRSDYF